MQKRMNKILMKIHINKDKDDEKFDEEKRWPLINIPDEDLTEDQLKIKRIQKMHRNAYITRLEKREIVKKERY
jgi:actin-related protein 5